jgi:four helix bundle protein
MDKIRNFTDLNAWKEGHKLVLIVYQLVETFPKKETYILTSQLLRAVISVTNNISEGFGRKGKKEKIQFYFVAQSSLTEIQNQLIIARDLKYLNPHHFKTTWNQTIIVHKLLSGLIKSIRNS